MDKRRLQSHVDFSIYNDAPIPSEEDWYTEEEFNQGYHFCLDWDGLFIEPGGIEWGSCQCHPLKEKEVSNATTS